MSRSSPSSRARRRVVCILPPPAAKPSTMPIRSPDFAKTTLLPYYQESSEVAPPRRPLVDPRRARRFCTDFGLGRSPLPPPFKMYQHDNSSSAGSTPQATYAETASDASSFYHDLDLVFPQPPASPAVRRMQSSPLFTSEETNAVRDFLRNKYMARQKDEEQLSGYSWDAESPDLELAGEALIQGGRESSPRDSWLQLDDSNEYDTPPLRPRRSVTPPSSATKRVLRRAASLASPPLPPIDDVPPLPIRSLRFQDSHTPPSLASAGRQKPRHRANLSMPLLNLGHPSVDAQPLGPSFTHRPAFRQSTNQMPRTTPKSFIDLTPEKKRESATHRDRVKKLLSRASSGFIGWSKGLAGKKRY